MVSPKTTGPNPTPRSSMRKNVEVATPISAGDTADTAIAWAQGIRAPKPKPVRIAAATMLKFPGCKASEAIASRQVKDNALVGCYLGVNGDQYKRSKVISEFYEITQDVIRVDPNKLTTIEEQVGRAISVQEVKDLLISHFETLVDTLEDFDISTIAQDDIDTSVKRMNIYTERFLD